MLQRTITRKGNSLSAIGSLCLILFVMTSSAQFRVIGYVHPWRTIPDFSRLSFEKITHLNIAFVNPDSTGALALPEGFDSLISTAHQFHVKTLASIGGGSHNPYLPALLTDSNRKAFVDQLVQLTVDHQLDGIDVDIENDALDSNYQKLVLALSVKLKPVSKLLTAAVATWNGEKISDLALKQFDFINVMSYDQTGPWTPEKPGPHSTYEKAVEDLTYWTKKRKIPKSKLNLGLPFYGYCFGTQYGASMSYSEIITNFPGAESLDEMVPVTGGNIYYNGLPTIKRKTRLAQKQAGGVMIWQLMQDDPGSNSLLTAINEQIGR